MTLHFYCFNLCLSYFAFRSGSIIPLVEHEQWVVKKMKISQPPPAHPVMHLRSPSTIVVSSLSRTHASLSLEPSSYYYKKKEGYHIQQAITLEIPSVVSITKKDSFFLKKKKRTLFKNLVLLSYKLWGIKEAILLLSCALFWSFAELLIFKARDNLVFLKRWFMKFPQYSQRELFLMGESYAGMNLRTHKEQSINISYV